MYLIRKGKLKTTHVCTYSYYNSRGKNKEKLFPKIKIKQENLRRFANVLFAYFNSLGLICFIHQTMKLHYMK